MTMMYGKGLRRLGLTESVGPLSPAGSASSPWTTVLPRRERQLHLFGLAGLPDVGHRALHLGNTSMYASMLLHAGLSQQLVPPLHFLNDPAQPALQT